MSRSVYRGWVSGSLVDWLRERPAETVVELLRLRPDLAAPPPHDTRVLATRAATRASVSRACDGLDAFTLSVLDAAILAGADSAPVTVDVIASWLGPVPARNIGEAIDRLTGLALMWGDDTHSIVPSAREASGAFPGGLGRAAEALEGVDIDAELAALEPPELRLVHTLAQGQPIGHTKDAAHPVPIEQAKTPVQKLLAKGLLLRRDAETVELPRQIALAVRGDCPLGTVVVVPPELATKTLDQRRVDDTAAGEALSVLRQLEAIIAGWSAQPAGVLRTGGIGVREMRKLAKELDVDEQRAALLVELLVGAGLAGSSDAEPAEWVPTTAADGWLAADPAQRWAAVATAWLTLPRLPWLAGQRDERDRLLGPLAAELQRPLAPQSRRRVLRTIAELPEGMVLDGHDSLVELLNWRNPRNAAWLRSPIVEHTMREASALGILAIGGLSTPGSALLGAGADEARAEMAAALPEPVNHVLVQADLTVVAPGPLEAELAGEMAMVGDVESAGGATVYRISDNTVRRALDSGRTAAELHELFRIHSQTPVPQSLSYLIDDVDRRHGQLRGGMAGSFLRCADPALLSEVMAGPAAGPLELRRIAENVVISPFPLIEVLNELRAHGFAPIAEGPDGQLIDLRPSGRRIPARSRTRAAAYVPASTPTEDRLAEVIEDMRAADRAAQARRGAAVSVLRGEGRGSGLSSTLAALREAAAKQQVVWVGLVDSRGTGTQYVLTPERIGGGALEGTDPDSGEPLRLPLHLITTVAVVES